jgi:hypothetical protein
VVLPPNLTAVPVCDGPLLLLLALPRKATPEQKDNLHVLGHFILDVEFKTANITINYSFISFSTFTILKGNFIVLHYFMYI